MTDQRYLTAHHEAGHGVAAVMRGAGELRSITIEPTTEYEGYTGFRSKPCDRAFVTYAGPWAEARAQWPLRGLVGEDDDGCTFGDYLTAAWRQNQHGDLADYERFRETDAALLGHDADLNLIDITEEIWSAELEREWPVIKQVAGWLLSGLAVSDKDVRSASENGADK
jgi:hypothetical protein